MMVLLAISASVATREAIVANQKKRAAAAVNSVLGEALNAVTSPGARNQKKEALDGVAKKVGDIFDDDPESESYIRIAIGAGYQNLGFYGESEFNQRRGVACARKAWGDSDLRTLYALRLLADVLIHEGDFQEVEGLMGKSIPVAEQDPSAGILRYELYQAYGWALSGQGKLAEALPFIEKARDGFDSVTGEKSNISLRARRDIACIHYDQGHHATAIGELRAVVNTAEQALPSDDCWTPSWMYDLAVMLERENNDSLLREAETLQRDALKSRLQSIGSEHAETLISYNGLAIVLARKGLHDNDPSVLANAEQYFLKAIDIGKRTLPPTNYYVACFQGDYGEYRLNRGQLAQAESPLLSSYQTLLKKFGESDWRTFLAKRRLHRFYLARNDETKAREYWVDEADTGPPRGPVP